MCKAKALIIEIFLFALLAISIIGCDDRVRQTLVPYFTSSLQTLSTGLIEALESELYPEGSSTSDSTSSDSSSSSSSSSTSSSDSSSSSSSSST